MGIRLGGTAVRGLLVGLLVTATSYVAVGPWASAAQAATSYRVYIGNQGSTYLSEVDGATNTVTTSVASGGRSYGESIAVSADGSRLYEANGPDDNVAVIDTITNSIVATIPFAAGSNPNSTIMDLSGSRVYSMVGEHNTSVAVINTQTNQVDNEIVTGGDGEGHMILSPTAPSSTPQASTAAPSR